MANRAKERVAVRFACTVKLGEELKSCTIQNISRGGVLTLWPTEEFVETPIRVGDKYQLEIRLSEHKDYGTKGLSCVGTVVRVTLDRQQVAFRISKARLGALGITSFAAGDPRSQYLM
jgi:PilZ domain